MLGVLHTWSRPLIYHPHIHYVIAGAGLSPDGLRWNRVASDQFFLPEKVLARRFRNRLRRALALTPELARQIPAVVWRTDWVVDSLAVGTGAAALKYLAAYVYKTALSSARILTDDERGITFRFRRSDDGSWQTLTLRPAEFLRRFLQHVLPRGFQRVRSYGWLAPAAKAKWQRIEALLDWQRPAPPPVQPLPLPECPHCHKPLTPVERLPRAPP